MLPIRALKSLTHLKQETRSSIQKKKSKEWNVRFCWWSPNVCDHSGLNCLLANLFPFKFTQKMLYYSTVCMESRTYACVSWNIHVNAYEMKNVVLCFYVQVQITVTWYLYSFFKVTEVTVISNEWITRKKRTNEIRHVPPCVYPKEDRPWPQRICPAPSYQNTSCHTESTKMKTIHH